MPPIRTNHRRCIPLILTFILLTGCSGSGLRTDKSTSVQTILGSPEYRLQIPSFTKLDAAGKPLGRIARSWSMVRDNHSGLVWEVKTEAEGVHYCRQRYDWQTAKTGFIDRLNREKFGGADDWRLPTVRELVSITDKLRFLPAVNTSYFPFTQAHDYWSAVPDAGDAANAWRVHFCRGYVNSMPKTNEYYVRAVRGASIPESDLVDNGDGTFTDRSTGLMWQQKPRWSKSWEEAIIHCDRLKLAGHSDWRLPHAHELQSLIDYHQSNPAADSALLKLKPLGKQSEAALEKERRGYLTDHRLNFWSATVYASSPKSAWVVDFKTGLFRHSSKTGEYLVRAVRPVVQTKATAMNSALDAAK